MTTWFEEHDYYYYFTVKQERIEDIVEREPLTMNHIQELSPHSDRYIIPRNQSNCKMSALILYNPENRRGAEKEADYMKESLTAAGFSDINRLQWTECDGLHSMIDSHLDIILPQQQGDRNCSLLMLCLMSHGGRGSLVCRGKKIPINDILHKLKYRLPDYLPLVSWLR